ncbi:MAG: hypothetical protein HY329_19240 [Chloroflexi bacterium]|nr:hypothetical protein [Chloroflexota bacterium]
MPSEVRAVVDLITTYYGHLGRRDFRSAYGVLNPEEQRQTDFQTYVRPYDGLQSLSLDRVEIADNGPGWVEADAFTTVVYHPGPGVSKPLVRGSGGG